MSFIGVHVGAGRFDDPDVKELKGICKRACIEGLKLLDDGVNANEVISAVVSILEDCPLTNAGVGSCLTYNGSVECDASLMSSNGHFASVGAVSGIRNPIQLVHQMIKEQSKGLMPLGRIPPMCLCGDGGYEWARLNGVPVCIPDDMITDRSKEIYIEHMERLNSEQSSKRFKPDNKIDKLDTVGAVCYDGKGIIAAGSSSGGISLKHSGRIGQAGVYGCGCWSENYHSHYIATTVSGVGEYLIKTQLAKELAMSMLDPSMTIQTAFQQKFIDSHYLMNFEPKHGGAICLHVIPSGCIEFSWVHSTDDMIIGYASSSNGQQQQKVVLSKLGCNDLVSSSKTNNTAAGWISF